MAQLGSKKNPLRVRVQTLERASELMAFCKEKDWQIIVGIEPNKTENIEDIEKMQTGKSKVLMLSSAPSRNAPCSCGSGKQYKRCCGK